MSNFFSTAAISSLVMPSNLITAITNIISYFYFMDCLLTNILTFSFSLRRGFLVSTNLLQSCLDQVVQSEALAVDGVLHHEVSEPGHVPRGVQDGLGR